MPRNVHHGHNFVEVLSDEHFKLRQHFLSGLPCSAPVVAPPPYSAKCLEFEHARSPGHPRTHLGSQDAYSVLLPSGWLSRSKSPLVFSLDQAIREAPHRRRRRLKSVVVDSTCSTDTEDGCTPPKVSTKKCTRGAASGGLKMTNEAAITAAQDISMYLEVIQKTSQPVSSGLNVSPSAQEAIGFGAQVTERAVRPDDAPLDRVQECRPADSSVKRDQGASIEGCGSRSTPARGRDVVVSVKAGVGRCVHAVSNISAVDCTPSPVRKTYSEVAAMNSVRLNNESAYSAPASEAKSLTQMSNVTVVCNDLQDCSRGTDTDSSEQSRNDELSECSCLSSEVESCSSDGSADDTDGMGPSLSNLVTHTTGAPLLKLTTSQGRRKLSKSARQKCLQYTHYYAQGSPLFRIDLVDELPAGLAHGEKAINSRDVWKQCRVRSVSDSLPKRPETRDPVARYHVTQLGPKMVQVSLGKPSRVRSTSDCTPKKYKEPAFQHVSIDLTNTAWTYTVVYHDPNHSPPPSQHSNIRAFFEAQDYLNPAYHSSSVPGVFYQTYEPMYYDVAAGSSASLHKLSYKLPLRETAALAGLMPVAWMPHPHVPHIPMYLYPIMYVPKSCGPPPPCSYFNVSCPPASRANVDFSFFSPNIPIPSTLPPERPWKVLQQPDTSRPSAIFTVMCYNVLCDKYCTRQLYGYCPPWALVWEYRKKVILQEIRNLAADIISLQEVETEQFYHFFLPELQQDGYDGIFSPKSRAKTMRDDERKHVDGCAIFYRTSKFTLIKHQLVEFNQLAMSNAGGHHDMINRVMTKDNIGLAALIETKEDIWDNGMPSEPKQTLLVATCHVHWDPEYSDVKLIQTMMLMSELKNIIQDVHQEHSTSLRPGAKGGEGSRPPVPLLLCGDLNSLPNSGVIEYLSMGRVAANHIDFKELVYEDCLQKLSSTENKEVYTHDFKLSQAYAPDLMPFTNYTYDFKGVIDYIFFSRDYMRTLGVLGPVEGDWFREHHIIGCPNPAIPSDHIPLLVEIEMPAASSQHGPGGPGNYLGNALGSSGGMGRPGAHAGHRVGHHLPFNVRR